MRVANSAVNSGFTMHYETGCCCPRHLMDSPFNITRLDKLPRALSQQNTHVDVNSVFLLSPFLQSDFYIFPSSPLLYICQATKNPVIRHYLCSFLSVAENRHGNSERIFCERHAGISKYHSSSLVCRAWDSICLIESSLFSSFLHIPFAVSLFSPRLFSVIPRPFYFSIHLISQALEKCIFMCIIDFFYFNFLEKCIQKLNNLPLNCYV